MKKLLKWLFGKRNKQLDIPVVIHTCDDLKKRTDECSECDMMVNYEDPDKWDGVKKCPKCGKDTEILKQAWD